MVRKLLLRSPAYVDTIRGLLRLHYLTENGQDESPEADALRDRLEPLWHDLTDLEKKRITGLSEDLYSISDPFPEQLPMSHEAHRGLSDAIAASRAGDPDVALALLRRWSRHLDRAKLSFERGCVWEEEGDSETALPFFEHAVKLCPGDDTYAVMYLSALDKSQPDASVSRSREIIAKADVEPPMVVARAALVIATSAFRVPEPEALPLLRKLMSALNGALTRLHASGMLANPLLVATHTSIIRTLGFCYLRMGEYQAAVDCLGVGLLVDPTDDSLLIARGTLRYGADSLATDDFEQAIRQGSTKVWPYFFMAHYHLFHNRFSECRRLCERALQLPGSDDVQANLNEWLAISEAELGFPPERVRSAFEAAIRLAPDFERIKSNLEKFERATREKNDGPLPWVEPTPSTIQAVGQANYSLIEAWPEATFRYSIRSYPGILEESNVDG